MVSGVPTQNFRPAMDLQQTLILKDVLERFCGYFGHRVNAWKIDIYFSKGIDDAIVLDVELWGIFNGLTLIHDNRYKGVMIQTYSLEAIKIIQDSSLSSSNYALIRRVYLLLANAKFWTIQHFPKDFNKVVNCLAKFPFDTNHGLKIFEEIPKEVITLSSHVQVSDSLAQRYLI
ncbi:hypothetical protein J1N35_004445 [Gossypium stocksii]|uniref:RNase H type-1 domain-containing protein n=1 Tax=Gossypium stocksii TaxID=47602 RepID=A0A9D3WDJ0_9ROSI|nr:hypothetical protein J1N35_004445 [Gossypium stocksii]